MILGIQQKDSGLRRAAYLIHCSLVDKKNRVDIGEVFPLPFDDKKQKTSTIARLKQIHLDLKKNNHA